MSIERGNAFVEAIKPLVAKTKRREVLQEVGGFASLFRLNQLKYTEPVLVSCTDGVGTKLKLAQELNLLDGIGVDLVAMCVNDLVCTGAEPLFFLDYYACGRLQTEKAVKVVAGMSDALAKIKCALIGGETAEMPGVYQEEEFDLAGFAVGVVNQPDIIDGSGIALGNHIIGIESSGVHSNGFSLVRKIIADNKLDLQKTYPGMNESLGEALLAPTKIYVEPILKLKEQFPLLGIAHITGGGLLENIPRVLPQSTQVVLNPKAWQRPALFKLLQQEGQVEESEMHRVFNCGIGMSLIVDSKHSADITQRLIGGGYPAHVIGEVALRSSPNDAQVVFA